MTTDTAVAQWFVDGEMLCPLGSTCISDADGATVALVPDKAHVALVLAAPDLLAALEDLRRELRNALRMDVRKHYSLMVADAAAGNVIAKARGIA